ncbi:MAG: tol-pal system protein YbgF [Proteobacteria bacterium]|nr:tol-pal system protein YbgF [Pseudomonadota bacterium]
MREPRFLAASVLLAGALALVVGAWPGVGALGQTREIDAMRAEIQRLQREVQDLQRLTYRGAPPPAATGSPASPAAESPQLTSAAQARIDQRLSELETELRALRGLVEQVTFQANRVAERLDKLVADVDFRLRAIESGTRPGPTAPQAQAPGGAAPSGPAIGSAPAAAPGPAAVERPAAAGQPAGAGRGEGLLGQLRVGPSEAAPAARAGPGPAVAAPVQPQAPVPPSAPRQAALASPPAIPATSPDEAYRRAYSLLKRADFEGAERSFKTFLETHPDHELSENARYWLGETYYVRRDFRQAAITFADGYKQHPKGAKATDNLLKLALAFGALEQKENACTTLARLRQEFPKARPAIKERADEAGRTLGCK